jgi:hypothetical protein
MGYRNNVEMRKQLKSRLALDSINERRIKALEDRIEIRKAERRFLSNDINTMMRTVNDLKKGHQLGYY